MDEYKKGSIIKCVITGIEPYGIFVSLENYYSGLIHISELSKEYVKDVNEFGSVGETIYARILDVDNEINQLKLSIKDVDYRINNDKKKKLIKETGNGFLLLKNNLQKWINNKIEEMSKKS